MTWLNRHRRWGLTFTMTGVAITGYGAFAQDRLGIQLGPSILSLGLFLLLVAKWENHD